MNIEQDQVHSNLLLPLQNPNGPQNHKKTSYMESDFTHISRPNPPNPSSFGSNPLRFFLTDIDTETVKVGDSLQEDTVVRLFGITEEKNTVLVRVENYQCHLTIEYPEAYLGNKTGEELEKLRLSLNNQLQMKACLAPDNVITKLEFCEEKYLKIYFVHPQYLQIFKEKIVFKEPGEAFHKPTRRCEDLLAVQFMADTGISMMSWVEIEAGGFTMEKIRTSECQIEVRSYVNNIKRTLYEALPVLRVLVIRTECEYMGKEKEESEGKLRRIMKIRNVYEEIGGEEGAKEMRFDLEEYKNEANMLRDWRRFLLAWDPDVVIGGNEVLEKDIKEIYKRAKMLKLNEYVGLGRAESKISALLNQDTTIPGLNGRIVIDMLAWILKKVVRIEDEKLERIQRELSKKDGENFEEVVLEIFKEMEFIEILKNKEIGAPIRLINGNSSVEREVSLVRKNVSEVIRQRPMKPLILKVVQMKDENHAELSLGGHSFEGIIEQALEENSYIKVLDYEIIGEALQIKEWKLWNGPPEILKIFSFLGEVGQVDLGGFAPKAPIPEPQKEKENVPQAQNPVKKVEEKPKKIEKTQEKTKEKPAKRGGKASSTTERKNGSTIYDFFKVTSLKHSNSGHGVGKEEEKTLLKKRSLMEDKEENLEPKIEKNLKVDNTEEFKAIRRMTVNTKRWTIKVRIYGKSTKLQVERKGIWSDYFVAEGMDEDGGEISIVFNEKELVESYYEKVVIGEIYVVSGGVLVDKVRRTYKSTNSLQILFMGDCPLRFELQENDAKFPGNHYKFTKLGDIKDEMLDVDVSVIGMVVKSKLENITKKDKNTVPVRKVTITDQYKETVELVLWDKLSEIRINLFDVVIVNKAKIRKFNNNKHLGMTQHTQIMTNYFPNYQEIRPFYTWVQKFYADKFGNLARVFPYIEDPAVNLREVTSSRDDNGTFESRVYVSYINKKSQSSYQACPNCRKNLNPTQAFTQGGGAQAATPSQDYDGNVYKSNVQVYDVGKDMQAQKVEKKLKERKEGEIMCVYCGSYMETAETVAIASVKLMDYTETVNASAFGNVAQVINPVEDQDVMETQWQEFRVKMRASLDVNSDRKYTILGMKPVDYREESLDIIRELERLKENKKWS